jgi:hypothetical protein
MAFIIAFRERRRSRRLIAVASLVFFAFAGTASAKEADTTSESRATCVAPLIEQPFLSFGDERDYVLAPGGSFEDSSLPGWSLEGGAGVAAGNEPFNLRGLSDNNSLLLPAGASATSPTMCVDLNWPTLRFVANQTDEKDAELKVEVLYPEADEKHATWHGAKKFKAKRKDGWRLTEDVKLSPDRGGKFAGGRPVALRFTNTSDQGSWQIDNVYVDPRCR